MILKNVSVCPSYLYKQVYWLNLAPQEGMSINTSHFLKGPVARQPILGLFSKFPSIFYVDF